MAISFLDNDPNHVKNIRKIKDIGDDYGAVLYSIDFNNLITDPERSDALIFLYEEMERLTNLYLILIKLDFLENNNFDNDRMIEHVVSPLLRAVLEGFMKVMYVFVGIKDRNDILTIENRFKEICGIFVEKYKVFYKDAVNIGCHDLTSPNIFSDNLYIDIGLKNFSLIKNAVFRNAGEDASEPDIISTARKNYMKYSTLCLYTHGNLSYVFRKRFDIKNMFKYNHLEELEHMSGIYISILIQFGLSPEESISLDKQVRKYKS